MVADHTEVDILQLHLLVPLSADVADHGRDQLVVERSLAAAVRITLDSRTEDARDGHKLGILRSCPWNRLVGSGNCC